MENWLVSCVLALCAGPGGALGAAPQEGTPDPPRTLVRHALLVGCSEYPALREALGKRYEAELALHGPANDVELVRRTLERVLGLAPEHTTVLAGWSADEASRPTRANILAHLERLTKTVRPGDQAIVFLAGHGSQQRVQRQKSEEEPDGFEEIFLAADARPAEKDQGYVPNSIRDDELGERVRAIRAAGAEVWLIIDSCHSGTMLRGGSSGASGGGGAVRLRGVDPALLGVDALLGGDAVRGGDAALRGGRAGRGSEPSGARSWIDGSDSTRIAALYGATSYGRAPEMELPYRAPGAQSHGLFSYLLCQELERLGPRASYRELADRIVAAYQAFPCGITIPTAEGDLAREIGSGLVAEAPLVCTLRSGIPFFNRGRLAGLEPGVVVQLFEVAQGAERAIARVEIGESDLFEARGKLVEGELAKDRGPWRARTDARPLGDYRLALALVHPDGSCAEERELPQALRAELLSQRERFPIVDHGPEAEPGAESDWWIVLAPEGRLWLRPGPREGGFDLCGVRPEELLDTLSAIQKVRNLRRFAGSAFTAEWRGDLDVWVERKSARGWQRLERDSALHPGEKIRMRLQKTGDAIYDVNLFYLDANYGAQLLPSKSGSPRLAAGMTEPIELTGEMTVTDDALGVENLLVFATPRTSASPEVDPLVDLRGIEQRGQLRGQLRGAARASEPFEDLLREVLRGENTRGAPQPVASSRGTQSLLGTLHTSWGRLAPPPWPRNVAPEPPRPGPALPDGKVPDVQLPAGAATLAPGPAGTAPPDPWLCGPRAALARSRPDHERLDLLLLGERDVEVVLIDLDEGAPAGADPAQLARERAFGADAAFLFGARRCAYYDRAGRGVFDLVLVDADGDGVAEQRFSLEGERWRCDEGVALPWLSQGYLPRLTGGDPTKKAEISARLQVLRQAE